MAAVASPVAYGLTHENSIATGRHHCRENLPAEIDRIRCIDIAQGIVLQRTNKAPLAQFTSEKEKRCIGQHGRLPRTVHRATNLPTNLAFTIRVMTAHAILSLVVTVSSAMCAGSSALAPAMFTRSQHHHHSNA